MWAREQAMYTLGSFNVLSISEVALDSFAVEFWGCVVLYSIVLSSVIQLNVRSGSRWACLFDVHEHDRLGFGMLSVETAALNPRAVFDCICVFSSYCDRKGR